MFQVFIGPYVAAGGCFSAYSFIITLGCLSLMSEKKHCHHDHKKKVTDRKRDIEQKSDMEKIE